MRPPAEAPHAPGARLQEAGPALRFQKRDHRAPKHFWEGTQRCIAPAETVERVRPHFKRLGLTRLADITGLDRIGIPTVVSVRPNGLGLSCDAGKGFTVAAAMASAAMECVERYHGEMAILEEFRASYEQVAERHVTLPLNQLLRARAALFTTKLPLQWTLGTDLLADREVAVPSAMVRLDKSCLAESLPPPFVSDSNGLSAGNNLLEALNGGILEWIERDAIMCHRFAWGAGFPPPRVALDTIEHATVRELIERCERADARLALFDCTHDTGVPVYMAYLYDRVVRHVGTYIGYGAHLDPGIAMVRAITEAVQGRLVYIAGARDDFFRHLDLRLKLSDDHQALERVERLPASLDARERGTQATPTFEGDILCLLERLRAVGIDQVVVVDLTEPVFDAAAIRVLIPGLEGCESESYRPGNRARAFVKQCQARAEEP